MTYLVTGSDDYWRGTATEPLKELEARRHLIDGLRCYKTLYSAKKIASQLLDNDVVVEHVRSAKKREIVIRRQRRSKGFFATYIW